MYDVDVFGDLERAIDELEIPTDGDAIAELIALRDRLDAAITDAVAAFDAAAGWDADGASSMTAWLRHRARQTARDAKRLCSTARRLAKLPATAAAYSCGELSTGQVAAIVANLSDATVGLFAAQEQALLPSLAQLGVADAGRAMQVWRQRAEATLPDHPPSEERQRSLHLSETLAGRFVLDGDLDAEGGGLVSTALRLAASSDVEGEPARSPSERRADALVDVCRWFLDHQQERRGGRHRPHLNVVIDAAAHGDGGALLNGPRLDADTVDRLLCDAGVHRVITAGRSAVLDYGWTTRTIPANLWSALVLRDRHCRFPGCDREAGWCEGHHVVPWTEGGPTRLDNLVLACSRHHHRLHQPDWDAKLLPDGELHITLPDGRVFLSDIPP